MFFEAGNSRLRLSSQSVGFCCILRSLYLYRFREPYLNIRDFYRVCSPSCTVQWFSKVNGNNGSSGRVWKKEVAIT